jgi:hypothetical protein
MRSLHLALAIAGAAGLIGLAAPAFAQSWSNPPSFYYQGPDGTYDSLGDLSRAIRGVPCGIECTQRAEARWGITPRHHRVYDADRY